MAFDPIGETELSRSDWQAVTVALHDVERCGCAASDKPAGRLRRLFRALFGFEPPRPLADPRLEAVRRFVCAVRREGARAADYAAQLAGFGYSPAQIEALRVIAR